MSAKKGNKHHQSKLTEYRVKFIRSSPTLSNNTLAEMYQVHYSTISLARSGKTWNHL